MLIVKTEDKLPLDAGDLVFLSPGLYAIDTKELRQPKKLKIKTLAIVADIKRIDSSSMVKISLLCDDLLCVYTQLDSFSRYISKISGSSQD